MKPLNPSIWLGVINLSPESMVSDSIASSPDEVLQRADWLRRHGCGIIDLGARSITPTAPQIDDAEEQRRLLPSLALLRQSGYRVSADTWSSATVLAALKAGVDCINFTGSDISPAALAATAEAGVPLILTYMPYGDAYRMRDAKPMPYRIEAIVAHLAPRVAEARAAGVREVVIDPNLGIIHPETDDHEKTQLQNRVLWNLDRLRELGCPILLYAARKPERLARILFASNVLQAGPEYIRTHHPDILEKLCEAERNAE